MTAVWREGKKHTVVDAFSCHPASAPTDKELEGDEELEQTVQEFSVGEVLVINKNVEQVVEATAKDEVLQLLVEKITDGFPKEKTDLKEERLTPFWNDRLKLTIADGIVMCNDRVVVPREMQQGVLQELHAAHQGQERAMQRARQTVYWPGMTNNVRNVVKACKECQVYQPSQQRESLLQDLQPTRPGEAIAADFFSCEGREYLSVMTRYSLPSQLKKSTAIASPSRVGCGSCSSGSLCWLGW